MLRIEGFGLGSWRRRKGYASSKEAYRSESLFGIDHGLDSVVHVLDEVDLRATKSTLVGDVKYAIVGLSVLSVSTSDVDIVLIGNSAELFLLSSELWKLDVDGSTHSSSEVGWAGGDVSKMLVISEFSDLFNLASSDGKSLEDLADVGSLLH